MSSSQIVKTRTPGWCSKDFAHPGAINVGDRIKITTYFPSDEAVRHFGVKPFSRWRTCSWCLDEQEGQHA